MRVFVKALHSAPVRRMGSSSRPLIAVVGATGTGKSQLAVDIASRFNGEVINGDALQLYEGLPIITNKIKEEEMNGVPHHLLGCIGLTEQTWTVGKFVENARKIIDDIHARGKIPVLVGGTHYYTQSLIFDDSVLGNEGDGDGEHKEAQRQKGPSQLSEIHPTQVPKTEDFDILDEPTDVLIQKLREVDPIMADRWHPNERRKIVRSLEIYLKTGKPASQVYAEQAHRRGNPSHKQADETNESKAVQKEVLQTTNTRYPTLLFWAHAEPEVLSPRLDSRVDKMVKEGLLSEIRSLDQFMTSEQEAGRAVDKTRGIWVSIGYKEFAKYQEFLKTHGSEELLQEGELKREGEKLKRDAVEKVKTATRQYAKRQIRWIRIKLLNAIQQAQMQSTATSPPQDLDTKNTPQSTQDLEAKKEISSRPPLYILPSAPATWTEDVTLPAESITSSFLSALSSNNDFSTLPDPTSFSPEASQLLQPTRNYDHSQRRDLWIRKTCELCKLVAVTENEWNMHIGSRGHRRNMKKAERNKDRQNENAREKRVKQTEEQSDDEGLGLFASIQDEK